MKTKNAVLILLPCIVILTIFMLWPLWQVLWPSVFGERYPLEAYVSFFADAYYQKILFRTLLIAVLTSLLCMLLGVPTAYYISRCPQKWKGLLLAVSIFPLMTNSVIRSFAWITILGGNGIVNSLLKSAGLIERPLKMLYTEFSIIIGSVYLFLPLMIVTVEAVMENIEEDLTEAAQSLGAGRLTAFMKIIFPMSLPGVLVGGILVFTGTLTAYTTPQLLGGNKHLVLATLIYQKAMSVGDWSAAAVIAFIMIVLTVGMMRIFRGIAQRLDKRGEMNA